MQDVCKRHDVWVNKNAGEKHDVPRLPKHHSGTTRTRDARLYQRLRLRFMLDRPCTNFFHLTPLPKAERKYVGSVDILLFAPYVLQQDVGLVSIATETLHMPDRGVDLDSRIAWLDE